MPRRSLAFAALIALSLVACTTHTAPTAAPGSPALGPTVPGQAAPGSDPANPPGHFDAATGLQPGATVRSCKTDSDCAVKDVGSCCGYFPMCVNKDAKTDPAAVMAQCKKDGMSSICGFREVSGCQCVQGQCEASTGGPLLK